jgi:enterobactin synthetase component D
MPAAFWWTPYEVRRFDATRFAVAGIDCPDSIAQSVQKRQAEFFYGRICARAALKEWGVHGQQVGIGASREPIWPAGVIGSITHSGSLAAAAVLSSSQYRGIGIDLEECGENEAGSLEALAGTVLLPSEQAFLRSQAGTLSEAVLYKLAFSAKESFYKAVFSVVGRFVDFTAIEIDALDSDNGRIGFTVRESLCEQWRPGVRGEARFALIGHTHVLSCVLW